MNSMWLVICYLLGAAIKGSLGYTGCTDTSLNYQGYTYTIDPSTQQKVWSHCGFPNPSFDYTLCGLTYTSGEHFLCDPDGLLSSQLESKKMSHIKHVLFGQLNFNWNVWKVNELVNLYGVCHSVTLSFSHFRRRFIDPLYIQLLKRF